ncbi:Mov34/MPN/PAD-1 family protein [Sphingomonas sp. GC_Shp_3]|uniref:Mov34/MPN/PAD-1 family protein n=1 Tax=Sphingomonas sp. GC_Shp_3 TaxID=2937383 RepID=UPI00226A124B|nr:Mov34/MPN/PAD-1 family protein [Sphingomonas sp. GC_Shp_3]
MTIWISEAVWDAMRKEGERLHPLETGGMLLGWRDGEDRVVTGMVGAGPAAKHGRFAFLPDHDWQIKQLREAFQTTAGDLDYLGDWHTHPDGIAAMSALDHKTFRCIAKQVRKPAMLIAAGGPGKWVATAWVWSGGQLLRRATPTKHEVKHLRVPLEWPETILT